MDIVGILWTVLKVIGVVAGVVLAILYYAALDSYIDRKRQAAHLIRVHALKQEAEKKRIENEIEAEAKKTKAEIEYYAQDPKNHVKMAKAEVEEKNATIKELAAEITGLKSSATRARGKHEKTTNEGEDRFKGLEAENKKQLAEIARLEELSHTQEADIQEMGSQVNTLRQEREGLEERMSATYEERLTELSQDQEAKNERLNEAHKAERIELEAELEEAQELAGMAEELQKENQELRAEQLKQTEKRFHTIIKKSKDGHTLKELQEATGKGAKYIQTVLKGLLDKKLIYYELEGKAKRYYAR